MCLQCRRPGFNPWVRKILWRRKWQPAPVFLPGEFHGQRRLAGYSPWGSKESDMSEQLTLSLSLFDSSSGDWRKKSKNLMHDSVAFSILFFFPPSTCYHLFFRMLKKLLQSFHSGFSTALHGRNMVDSTYSIFIRPEFSPWNVIRWWKHRRLLTGIVWITWQILL